MVSAATAADASEPHPRPAKRPRVLVACQRCKTRRQKCDNGSPACSNCARSGASCVYSDRTAYPPSYVRTLEERVRQLEARLQEEERLRAQEEQHLHAAPPAPLPPHPAQHPHPAAFPPDAPLAGSARADTPPAPGASRLVTGMGLLSSAAAAEPHYFGFSAGLSLAHFVQVAIDSGSTSSDAVSLPALTDRPFANQALSRDTTPASRPSWATGAAYVRAYLFVVHPLYPFLRRPALWRLHSQYTGGGEEEEEDADADADADADVDLMDAALLHLVYAIGSRCLQLLGHDEKTTAHAPEGHFLRAMQIIGAGLQFTSMRSIELTLLLALHSMRSPSGTSVWHLAGLAVRQCIELGLHKQRAAAAAEAALRTDQHKKTLFWSVYIFERKTALVLGRPFALADEEIDLALPRNVDDGADDEGAQLLQAMRAEAAAEAAAAAGGGAAAPDGERRTRLSFHRAHVALYQLHAQIRLALYQLKRAPEDPGPLQRTMARLLDALDAWKGQVLRTFGPEGGPDPSEEDGPSAPAGPPFGLARSVAVEQAELLLEYHKARRSLLQPLLTEGRSSAGRWWWAPLPGAAAPADGLAAACADASGQICQLYRRLHRLSPIPFSLRDLHAIFVAGFTLLYAVCSCPPLYSAQRARDIGACSTLLHVIAAQWASARQYRDAFEVVAEKMELRLAAHVEAAVPGGMGAVAVAAAPRPPSPAPSAAPVPPVLPTAAPAVHASSPAAASPGPPTPDPPTSPPAAASPGFGLDNEPGLADDDTAGPDDPDPGSPSAGLELDLEADVYGIEGLLSREGLDWFTEAVLWEKT